MATEGGYSIPYYSFAIAAGPFLRVLARRWGLGTLAGALVVGLGVLVLAGALALIPARRTKAIWVVVALGGALAMTASLLCDTLFPS